MNIKIQMKTLFFLKIVNFRRINKNPTTHNPTAAGRKTEAPHLKL